MPEVPAQGAGRFGFSCGVSPWLGLQCPHTTFSLQCIHPWCVYVCVYVCPIVLLSGHQSYWIRPQPSDLVLPSSPSKAPSPNSHILRHCGLGLQMNFGEHSAAQNNALSLACHPGGVGMHRGASTIAPMSSFQWQA